MPIINVDLSESKEPQALNNGRYTVRVLEEKTYFKEDTGKESWGVFFEVIEGSTQKDGSDSEGRRLASFFPLNKYTEMKDGGDYVKRILKSFLDAAQIDESMEKEDAVGQELDVITRIEKDRDGIPQAVIKHYRVVGE